MENDTTAADEVGSFLAENADYFTQLFQPMVESLGGKGGMTMVSEEADYTVAVDVSVEEESGELEVDCVILDPDQESLHDCFLAMDEGSEI